MSDFNYFISVLGENSSFILLYEKAARGSINGERNERLTIYKSTLHLNQLCMVKTKGDVGANVIRGKITSILHYVNKVKTEGYCGKAFLFSGQISNKQLIPDMYLRLCARFPNLEIRRLDYVSISGWFF